MTPSIDARIRDLVAHAYTHAPAIKGILNAAGLTPAHIQGASDLAKIPVTSKDALVKIHQENPPFGGFLAVDSDSLPRIYVSPGPIFDPQPPNPEGAEAALAPFKYAGFGRGDRVLNTFMYHLVPAGILLDEALRACGATVIPTGPGNTDYQIEIMTKLGATGFVGQPSYLGIILDRANELGIPRDKITLKKALFSAEPYTLQQRFRFEGEYGMKTTSAYGTADLGVIGYTREGVEGFCLLDSIYAEICDPASGQPLEAGSTGEIVVTTFNQAYPLVRFGTGDLGALAAVPAPECGAGQQLLGIYGRSGGAVKVRGMFLHPDSLGRAKVFFPQIRHIQAVITRPGSKDYVTVLLEMQPGESGESIGPMIQQLAEQAIRLRIDEVKIVPEGTINPSERAVKDEREWE